MSEATPLGDKIPRLRSGIDLTKLGLSAEEGFLVSRIDGATDVRGIAHLVGKSVLDAAKVLTRLERAGVIRYADRDADDADDEDDEGYGSFIFPPALMHEDGALDLEERKKIIWCYEHLDSWTHYELLEVGRKSDAKELKRAYFARSKEWHPDRFRRGDLGSFKKMIETIFKRIQAAHDELADPERRRTYDAANVLAPDEDEIAEMLAAQRKIERDERRAVEANERRKRRNPMKKRVEKARKIFDEAIELEKTGDLLGALRAARVAHAFEDRAEHVELVAVLSHEAAEHRVGPYLRRAAAQESLTNFAEAVETLREALAIAPNHGPVQLRLAYNMLMSGCDAQEARTHAQRATQLLTDDPEAHFVLGMCYERGGMEKAAVREFSRAVELKPNYAEAKKRLKKLKWGF